MKTTTSLLTFFILVVNSIAEEKNPIKKAMNTFIDEGVLSGAVTLVGDNDKILSIQSCGYSNLQSMRKMETDNLFWIASMTKPMTAICIMQLHEEGKLSIEDPEEKHLPEIKLSLIHI